MNQNTTATQAYYDNLSPHIADNFGTHTLQGGTLIMHSGDPFRYTNVWMAKRAGIRPNQRVLDAGCGIGGPAIDIARAVTGVEIDGVTLSPVQVEIGRNLAQKHQLTNRVRFHQADYHQVPFEDGTFDVVYFFESVGYSRNPAALFTEMRRVLKPNGRLYLKAVVHEDGTLTAIEQKLIDDFNAVYGDFNTPSPQALCAALTLAGFTVESQKSLRKAVTTKVCEALTLKLNRELVGDLNSAEAAAIRESGRATKAATESLIYMIEIRAIS